MEELLKKGGGSRRQRKKKRLGKFGSQRIGIRNQKKADLAKGNGGEIKGD